MFESVSRSFILIRESWRVLTLDKEILLFPILSGLALLIILISFVIPALFLGPGRDGTQMTSGIYFITGIFLFYLLCYFIVIFFNTALITCARIRLTGGDPVFMDGIRNAVAHLIPVLVWALISATVGLVLSMLQRRAGFLGQIVITLIGAAWSLVTFFVIPVMIFEGKGAFSAIKTSASLFRKTWGESIVGQASIGIIFGLLVVIGMLPVAIALITGSFSIFIPLLAIFVLFLAVLMVISTSLQGIFNTALYLYATTGIVPEAFTREIVENAFVPKNVGGMRGNI